MDFLNSLLGFDMPQPIPPGKKINFNFDRTAVLKRPTLAPYIASIAMHWNEIEAHLAIFLAALLGGQEAQTVMKIFLALQTDGGRKTTMDTVAKLKLSPDDLERFQEIQRDIGGRYSERNKAIHGAWGISSDYPDELLWYDPRESTAAFPALIATASRAEWVSLMETVNKNIRIYRESDFTDILGRFNCTFLNLQKFTTPYMSPMIQKMNELSR